MELENSLLRNSVRVIYKEDMTMIKTTKGKIKLKGKLCDILADYSVITKNLIEALVENGATREDAVKDVAKAHRLGSLTEQEFIDENMEHVRKILMDVVSKMSDEKEDGGEADE